MPGSAVHRRLYGSGMEELGGVYPGRVHPGTSIPRSTDLGMSVLCRYGLGSPLGRLGHN